jgi:hypothetical protein
MSEHVLDGTWAGYYEQLTSLRTGEPDAVDDHLFPITAHFKVSGGRLQGEMEDGVPETVILYREVVRLAADTLSAVVKRQAEWVLDRHPDIKLRNILPAKSDLAGAIVGETVTFTKRYRGMHRIAWIIDGVETGQRFVSNHRVHYEGTISPDGQTIEGRWRIYHRTLFGLLRKVATEGRFLLHRQATG